MDAAWVATQFLNGIIRPKQCDLARDAHHDAHELRLYYAAGGGYLHHPTIVEAAYDGVSRDRTTLEVDRCHVPCDWAEPGIRGHRQRCAILHLPSKLFYL